MNRTKIEWADMTWNPVTGCRHGCDYCFARGIAHRFAGHMNPEHCEAEGSKLHVLDQPLVYYDPEPHKAPWPFEFEPTLHRYRLSEPAAVKKPQNIFTVDMGDLFGEWVPDEWIQEVFEACEKAPQHNYLFLTKNPYRIKGIATWIFKPKLWVGTSITGDEDHDKAWQLLKSTIKEENKFLSIEPLTHPIDLDNWELLMKGYRDIHTIGNYLDWVIVGAMTGPGSAAHRPQRAWVEAIVEQCRAAKVPVFLKNNLAGIWGQKLIQEWPEGLREVAEANRRK